MDENIKLLVIGNGFDLACGLPTKYTDFMDVCIALLEKNLDDDLNSKKVQLKNTVENISNLKNELTDLKSEQDIDDKNVCISVDKESKNNLISEIDKLEQRIKFVESVKKYNILKFIKDNVWIYHFINLMKSKLGGENWIDFESEISTIIQFLDEASDNLDDLIKDAKFNILDNKGATTKERVDLFLKMIGIFSDYFKNKTTLNNSDIKKIINIGYLSFTNMRTKFYNDLQRLTCALEIYLLEVEKQELEVKPILKNINPDMVLSFNYTNTAEKIYKESLKKEIAYIHGECKENSTLDTNNMVLGIDEYWTDDRKNTHTNYAIFKKFVQRIQKKTNIDIDKLSYYSTEPDGRPRGLSPSTKEIHIYGHSLDVTDKDILKQILTFNHNPDIIIYCYDKPTQGEYISNLIKIIGQDAVIERCQNGNIEFIIIPKEE